MNVIPVSTVKELPRKAYLLIGIQAPDELSAKKLYASAGLPVGDDVTVYRFRSDWYYPKEEE